MPRVEPAYFSLEGGLDQVTPPLKMNPGRVLESLNYECAPEGGYKRIGGYERYDGLWQPSTTTYWVLYFDAGSTEITTSHTIDGGSSGATAMVKAVEVESGDWATNDAAGYLVLLPIAGEDDLDVTNYTNNENLDISGGASSVAVADGTATENAFTTPYNIETLDPFAYTDHYTYTELAVEAARNSVNGLAGSVFANKMRGVWLYNGSVYAIKDADGGGSATMYKAVVGTWTACDLGHTLSFDAGDTEPVLDEVVTGGTSSAVGTIKKIIKDSGDWGHADLQTNGVFDADTDWTKGANWSIAAGVATHTAGATADLEQDITVTEGETYHVTYTVSGRSAGDITVSIAGTAGTTRSTNGTFEEDIVAGSGGSPQLEFTPSSAFNGSIDDVIVHLHGDAVGRLILYSVSGTFQDDEELTAPSGFEATADGANSANALSDLGNYEFVNYNFGGHAGTLKMYGANGVDPAFEWDGSVFVPILTGMTTDTPTHIAAHKKHLFLSFSGGSVQHSGIGTPYVWSVISGAAELGIGQEVVGFKVLPGEVLAIFGRNKIDLLYGSSSSDWNIKTHSDKAGAIEWTIQDMGYPFYLDDSGFKSLLAAQEYGDFISNTESAKIQPLLDSKRGLAISSVAVHKKNQYRIFFSDNTAIYITFDRDRVLGFMHVDLGIPVRAICNVEDSNGEERIFFVSDDQYVYEMDAGNSRDGTQFLYYMRLPFYHLGSPQRKKRFHQLIVDAEMVSTRVVRAFYVSVDYDYGGSDVPQSIITGGFGFLLGEGGSGTWTYGDWNNFYSSSQTVAEGIVYLDGTAKNIGTLFYGISRYDPAHTINGITIRYTPRGIQR